MSRLTRVLKIAPYIVVVVVVVAMIAHCCYMHSKTEEILSEYEELRHSLEQFETEKAAD